MVRHIKRYGGGSRKLYDTREARYVSLEEIGRWVRAGERLEVLDAKSGEDVTAQTLAQVIYEDERRGVSLLPSDLLHDIIRRGEQALTKGVARLQHGVGQLVDQVTPWHNARAEMTALRRRLDELERSLSAMQGGGAPAPRRKKNR